MTGFPITLSSLPYSFWGWPRDLILQPVSLVCSGPIYWFLSEHSSHDMITSYDHYCSKRHSFDRDLHRKLSQGTIKNPLQLIIFWFKWEKAAFSVTPKNISYTYIFLLYVYITTISQCCLYIMTFTPFSNIFSIYICIYMYRHPIIIHYHYMHLHMYIYICIKIQCIIYIYIYINGKL